MNVKRINEKTTKIKMEERKINKRELEREENRKRKR
jgi:hypothetical protein